MAKFILTLFNLGNVCFTDKTDILENNESEVKHFHLNYYNNDSQNSPKTQSRLNNVDEQC